MIHVKDSRSYQWSKFGRLGGKAEVCSNDTSYTLRKPTCLVYHLYKDAMPRNNWLSSRFSLSQLNCEDLDYVHCGISFQVVLYSFWNRVPRPPMLLGLTFSKKNFPLKKYGTFLQDIGPCDPLCHSSTTPKTHPPRHLRIGCSTFGEILLRKLLTGLFHLQFSKTYFGYPLVN